MTGKLVLCRHGQSDWNLKNLFTGWTDVDLTEKGMQEAIDAGQCLLELDSDLKPVSREFIGDPAVVAAAAAAVANQAKAG